MTWDGSLVAKPGVFRLSSSEGFPLCYVDGGLWWTKKHRHIGGKELSLGRTAVRTYILCDGRGYLEVSVETGMHCLIWAHGQFFSCSPWGMMGKYYWDACVLQKWSHVFRRCLCSLNIIIKASGFFGLFLFHIYTYAHKMKKNLFFLRNYNILWSARMIPLKKRF